MKTQLQAFASGERRNDISQQMRNIAHAMTPQEIETPRLAAARCRRRWIEVLGAFASPPSLRGALATKQSRLPPWKQPGFASLRSQ
jgi:hypothetical protein